MSVLALGALAVAGAAWLFLAGTPTTNRSAWPKAFASNGERIYFTGASASGQQIQPKGGNQHMTMMGGGCVACHGADRQGGRLTPSLWTVAPPLTAEALFEEAAGDDGHGDHGAYTEATLRRAITEGIDAGGERLGSAMPQWSMSEADLNDIVAFLQSGGEAH